MLNLHEGLLHKPYQCCHKELSATAVVYILTHAKVSLVVAEWEHKQCVYVTILVREVSVQLGERF